MACALCTSNAPRPVAFPLRLTGSCPLNRTLSAKLTSFFVTTVLEPSDPPLDKDQNAEARPVFVPTVRLLGKIDLADYLHSDRSSIVGGSNFLKFFHDTLTLKLSQRLDHSRVESVSILGRRIALPEPSADPDF